jgi:hypothetical protein
VKKIEGGWTTYSSKWMDGNASVFISLPSLLKSWALTDMLRKSKIICDLLQNTLLCEHRHIMSSLDIAVGIATGYGLDSWGAGVWILAGARFLSSPHHSDRLWGSTSLLSNRYQELFLWEVKWPGHEVDHSPPTSAEVKNMWIYTSTPTYAFMA